MIRYALACAVGHSFESWFSSSEDFDAQAARGLVTCPYCGRAKVAKQIMAPSVARRDREPEPAQATAPAPALPVPAAAAPVALVTQADEEMREAIRQLRAFVSANAEDVGRSFAEEARRIHDGEAPERFIMGEATGEEVAELLDDGIPIQPLPVLPDDRN